MALKVMLKEVKTTLMEPGSLLLAFLGPFIFRFLARADSGSYPAVLMIYLVLGLFLARVDSTNIKAGLSQFPVTARDHVLGMFLYQAFILLFAALITFTFITLTGPEHYLPGILPKTLGLGLAITGILSLSGLRFKPEVTRILSTLIIIASLNFVLFNAGGTTTFMPFISEGLALGLGAGCWLIFLFLGLKFPPRF